VVDGGLADPTHAIVHGMERREQLVPTRPQGLPSATLVVARRGRAAEHRFDRFAFGVGRRDAANPQLHRLNPERARVLTR